MDTGTNGWCVTNAAGLDDTALAALFERVYEGYPVPVHVDAATMRTMIDRLDLVPAASRVGHRDGVPVALAMLGLRGEEAWIGGMGVLAEHRRGGDGRRIMQAAIDEARRRGARTLRLEVLEKNVAALALYRELGFVTWRSLEVWARSGPWRVPAGAPVVREVALAEARAWIAARRRADEPWQRADVTLERSASMGTPLVALEARTGGACVGAAVLALVADRASVLQSAIADGRDDARTVAGALAAAAAGRAAAVRYLNVPAGDPFAAAFIAADGTLEARQHEMALTLAGSEPRG